MTLKYLTKSMKGKHTRVLGETSQIPGEKGKHMRHCLKHVSPPETEMGRVL